MEIYYQGEKPLANERCTSLFAKKRTSLFANYRTSLIAKKCTLLIAIYNILPPSVMTYSFCIQFHVKFSVIRNAGFCQYIITLRINTINLSC